MSIPELIINTKTELGILSDIVEQLVQSAQKYPKEGYNTIKLSKLEHCHKTLETLNYLLTEQIIS